MQITKIKIKDDKVEIHYSVKRSVEDASGAMIKHTDEYVFKSTEKPAPEFKAILQDLAEDVCNILELDDNYITGIEVTGVSFSYTSDVMGAVITAKKTLVNTYSPFNLNTPFKPSKDYNGNDDANTNLLDTTTVTKLENLLAEAEDYINGKRAQEGLFDNVKLEVA